MNTWRKVGCCLLAASAACFAGVAWGETYYLRNGGDTTNTSPSFDTANNKWTLQDGRATTGIVPSEGNDYVVEGTSETPSAIRMNTTPASKAFGGDSLTLRYGQLNLRVASVTVDDLKIDTFGRICNQANGELTLKGNCTLLDGAELELWSAYDVNNRWQKYETAISGAGKIKCDFQPGTGKDLLTAAAGPIFAYDSENGIDSLKDFTGKIEVVSTEKAGAKLTVTLNSLPGDPGEPMADAITVDYGATLKLACSGMMGTNRGFTFTNNGKPVIEVAIGCTVTIYGPMVAPNGFKKTGAGTLQLLGDNSEVNVEDVQIEGGNVVWGDSVIVAEVTGYDGAVDGATHSPNVEFSAPANGEGCTIQWQVVSDDTPTWSTTTPSFSEAGLHIVKYQITCEGRATRRGMVAMRLGNVGAVAFVGKNKAASLPYDTPETAAGDLATAAHYVYNLDLPEGSPRYVAMLPGFYSLSSAVAIGTNLCVVGFGEDQTVISTSSSVVSAVALEGSEIREITFDGAKNAIQARDGSTVNRCVVRNAAGGSKYAIRAEGAVTVKATTVTNNNLDDLNINANAGNAPFVLASDGAELTVTDSQVCNNTVVAPSCSAGVLAAENTAYNGNIVVFDRCVFTNNLGRCGFCRIAHNSETNSTLTMRNCLCIGCKSVDRTWLDKTDSASVFIYAFAGKISNCTFDECWANGELVYVGSTKDTGDNDHMTIHNCIFRNIKDKTGNSNAIGVSTLNRSGDKVVKVDHSVVYPKVDDERLDEKSETNYFEQDVTFVGPGKRQPEYALAGGSYGLKMGDPLVWADYPNAVDLAGKPRVVGGKVDVGCYQTVLAGLMLIIR